MLRHSYDNSKINHIYNITSGELTTDLQSILR